MLYTEKRRGIAPVEMCTEAQYPRKVMISSHASLWEWMPSSGQSSFVCLQLWRLRCPSMWEILAGVSSFSSSASDTRNSKLEESTRLMCSTGLLMHDLIIDFDMYKLWLCRYDWKFLVFCITIFPEQAQNKNKVGIKTTFLFNDENT